MNKELKMYINGIKVEYDAETLQTLKEEYDIEPRFHSPDKLHFTATFEVEDDYPMYKLLHSSDIGASKARLRDIRNRYYTNRIKLMNIWQKDQ